MYAQRRWLIEEPGSSGEFLCSVLLQTNYFSFYLTNFGVVFFCHSGILVSTDWSSVKLSMSQSNLLFSSLGRQIWWKPDILLLLLKWSDHLSGCYYCSLTELFTKKKHAMDRITTLYHMDVFHETILFDTMKEKYRRCMSVFFFVLFFIKLVLKEVIWCQLCLCPQKQKDPLFFLSPLF